MRNAAAAVAAADNWRNVLREPLDRISLVFIRPSSNTQIVSGNLAALRRNKSGRIISPGLRPLWHRIDGRFKSQFQHGWAGERPRVILDGGNEIFDGEDRIDFCKR